MPPARAYDEYTRYIRLAEIEQAIWRGIIVSGQLLTALGQIGIGGEFKNRA